ncbi:GntR family transcriptional regulator [Mucilaginibacter sp. UR6-1]|uniref:GntR family transcriptional regulator n=1 Tax=Mucilaginibacter sp. UR6-1 TaxID=1435643 RepID=UPI001E52B989|nr:GntR family transcriptional regulator [Mucilaginibacter sp. UR6-1]MCC8409167.1 GntR family transcriptional regulator [Mucilaginibacter sp. UR6-1]
MKNFLKILSVDEYSITPKYLQLVNSVLLAIENGNIVEGDVMPSINDLSFALDISRNTIERFYNELKKSGIMRTVPGKGAFIQKTDFDRPLKLLLLFNKLSTHKKIIYDAFVETIGKSAVIDFYVYNNDFYLFKKIITEKVKLDYDKIIIVPYFIENDEESIDVIKLIPREKLVIMDKLVPQITGKYIAVFEDFEGDIFNALVKLLDPLKKYDCLKIVFPSGTYHSNGILTGFRHFCNEHFFEYEIVNSLAHHVITTKTAYITVVEDDLVHMIQAARAQGLEIGVEVGIISYNETAIKQVILNGITTISTDFNLLGSKTAELILKKDHKKIAVPFSIHHRPSL